MRWGFALGLGVAGILGLTPPAEAHGGTKRDLSELDPAAAWPEVVRFGPELKATYGGDATAVLVGGRGLLHLGDGPYIGTAGYIGARLTGPSSPAEIAYGGGVIGWDWRVAPGISVDTGVLGGLFETPIAGQPIKELRAVLEPTIALSYRVHPGMKTGIGVGYLYSFGSGVPPALTLGARLDFKQLALLFPED